MTTKKSTITNDATHPTINAPDLIADLVVDSMAQLKLGKHPTPVMIWGQPGVGKSQITRAVGKKTGRPVVDIRLLLKDPTDLSGLPYFNPKTNKMEYAHPCDLPDENGEFKNAILLLDELPAAPQAVQSAALQLVLERQIGTYQLPEGVMILAAGNRATDGASYNNMPTPLRNRFRHYTLEVDTQAWLEHARDVQFETSVQAYIRANPSDLNTFDPSQRHVYASATPRSWEFVSNDIANVHALRKQGFEITNNDLFRRISSTVGEGIRSKFKTFYEDALSLPDPYQIVSGDVTTFKIEKTPMKYACSLNVMYALREVLRQGERNETLTTEEYNKFVENAISFIINNIDEKDIMLAGLWIANDPEYRIRLTGAPSLLTLVDNPEFDHFFTSF